MMAFGPEGVVDIALSSDMPSYAPNTVIARSDVLHLLEQFRACGYSYSDQFFTKEIISFGMPFFGPDGEAIGTLAVPLPRSRLSDGLKSRILASLRHGCEAITHSCGGAIPTPLAETWEDLPISETSTHDEIS